MLTSPLVTRLIALALEEDMAFGDITARLTVPENHRSTAKVGSMRHRVGLSYSRGGYMAS